MNRLIKSALAGLLTLSMLGMLLSVMTLGGAAAGISLGKVGESITATYDATTQTLTLNGEGEMYDYGKLGIDAPWYEQGIETDVKTLVIGEGITAITDFAFSGFKSLTRIEFPSYMERIGHGAFASCKALTYVELPIGISAYTLGQYAFKQCYGLQSVILPVTVSTISQSFFGEVNDTTIVLPPDSIDGISPYHYGDSVFYNCNKLTTVTILNATAVIADNAATIQSGRTICGYAGSTAQAYATRYGRIFSALPAGMDAQGLVYRLNDLQTAYGVVNYQGMATDIVIPSTYNGLPVTGVAAGALMSSDTALNSITVSDGVATVGSLAFADIPTLKSLTFEGTVTDVGAYALSGLTESATVTFSQDEGTGDFHTLWDADCNAKIVWPVSILYGDANGDSVINGKDILIIRKYLANYNYDTGMSTVEVGKGSDANGDATINGKDILIIRKYLANYNYDTGESTIVLGPAGQS